MITNTSYTRACAVIVIKTDHRSRIHTKASVRVSLKRNAPKALESPKPQQSCVVKVKALQDSRFQTASIRRQWTVSAAS